MSVTVYVVVCLCYVQIKELVYDYTHCENVNNPGQTCAEYFNTLSSNLTFQTCTCIVTLTLDEDFKVSTRIALS